MGANPAVQERVACAQRQLKSLGEPQHHGAARPRATCLQETQMPRRDFERIRELQLGESALLPQCSKLLADIRHDSILPPWYRQIGEKKPGGPFAEISL